MRRQKVGLVIPHPEEQKWDTVWKIFRMPNLTLPTLAALIPDEDWDIEIQDELVGPLDFDRDYDGSVIKIVNLCFDVVPPRVDGQYFAWVMSLYH